MQLRKIIKTRVHFPNTDSAIKLLWLALRHVLNKTVRRAFDWKIAMHQFAILYGDAHHAPLALTFINASSRQSSWIAVRHASP